MKRPSHVACPVGAQCCWTICADAGHAFFEGWLVVRESLECSLSSSGYYQDANEDSGTVSVEERSYSFVCRTLVIVGRTETSAVY